MIDILAIPVIFLTDQKLKDCAKKEWVKEKRKRAKGYITLSFVKNKGAFLGIGKNQKEIVKGVSGISAVLLAIYYVVAILHKFPKVERWGTAFLLGGAMSNLYDRYKDGYVTDFFALKWTKNIYYNIGDMFIFLGSIMIGVSNFFKR